MRNQLIVRDSDIQLVCRYKLDKQIAAQSRAFFDGLSDIIDSKWLRMFDQQELRQLIGGEETLIDLDDLRAHVHVTGFPNDVTMKLFWRVVKRFTQEERRALLRFVTSCSRPPLSVLAVRPIRMMLTTVVDSALRICTPNSGSGVLAVIKLGYRQHRPARIY